MEDNPTRICELLVGLGDVEVLGVDDDAVELATARWQELQRGCRAGPALEGFRCG